MGGRQRPTRLAYDIETPYGNPDESETGEDDSYHIERVGFSYRGHQALSIPWAPEYLPAIRLLLEADGDKVVWNAGFDNPRIRAAGVAINGVVHDGMVAWHILHSDLPKGLGFVATFCCPGQPAWKHLSSSRPAFYNATDADVELRCFEVIEEELRRTGLWDVYQRDVLDLDPVLRFMSDQGMPVDQEVRYDYASKLAIEQRRLRAEMADLVPLSARSYSPKGGYVKTPDDLTNCVAIEVEATVKRCSRCGYINPTKPHFRTLKKPTVSKPQNPCAGASVVATVEKVERFARLDPFKPSRNLLIRYQQLLGRKLVKQWDKKSGTKKVSMDEKALKELQRTYPGDRLYPAVLEDRELDKLAGTYIGRPGGASGDPLPTWSDSESDSGRLAA